ncbi:MAG: ABC transporter ATP-binding protein [Christensenella sp.]|uniref:ABC transporter ATP-binding protein n=1 Tax=Christensenella sp. TaxID=1935934 RepID=UPI002B205E7F|nr:ABC transporter ATP-binding protein [Christensenella sp.]MEA5002872.1 ABC transporter ATP-binding protein [Christensenella sp.]
MSTLLDMKNVEKVYGSRGNITKALDNVSFTVENGEFLGIMGPSGSGKTTLLNCVSTIDTVTTGHILIAGVDITTLKPGQLSDFRREKLGFIFQDFNLLDTLSGYENIALALTICNVGYQQIKERIKEVSKTLEISDVLYKYPYEMSGGQKQRVAAARAIITNPSLILADEPTGALDSKSSRMMLESFVEMNQKMNATLLMVTHDAFAASYCRRILFLRDGKIFMELVRGNESRKEFFSKIIEVVSLLGGDVADAV